MPRKVAFAHIPKTGGTSLLYALAQAYGYDNLMPTPRPNQAPNSHPEFPSVQIEPQDLQASYTESDFRDKQCVFGHFDGRLLEALPEDWTLITMVREPLRQVRSRYDHITRSQPGVYRDGYAGAARDMGLMAWITGQGLMEYPNAHLNVLTRYLSGKRVYDDLHPDHNPVTQADVEQAKRVLDKCLIGDTDHFAQSLKVFSHFLDVDLPYRHDNAHQTPFPEIDDALREWARQHLWADYEVYTYARAQFDDLLHVVNVAQIRPKFASLGIPTAQGVTINGKGAESGMAFVYNPTKHGLPRMPHTVVETNADNTRAWGVLVEGVECHIVTGVQNNGTMPMWVRSDHHHFDYNIARETTDYEGGLIDLTEVKTLVDIGGHIGGFTRWVATRSKAFEQGVLVEPEPRNAELACLNTAGLPVTVLEVAIGTGEETLLAVATENTGGNYLTDGTDPLPDGMNNEIPVQVTDFRRVLDTLPSGDIDLLKLDCEGAEHDILMRTHHATLKRFVAIVGEWHGSENGFWESVGERLNRWYFVSYTPIADQQGVFRAKRK